MEKEDLRIGDLVQYYDNVTDSVIKCYVEEITDKQVVLSDKLFDRVLLENVYPIILTEEILKKNDWKRHKAPYQPYYHYKKKGYPTLNYIGGDFYFYYGSKNVPIYTVGDLQHLLFGLKVDSEIIP